MATTPPNAYVGPGRLYLTVGGGTEAEYICELTGVRLVPTYDTLRVKTGCPGGVSKVTEVNWDLQVGLVQDLSVATSLSRVLVGNHAAIAEYVFIPTGETKDQISATIPGYTGECTLTAVGVGALATEIAVSEGNFPVKSVTEITTAPA